MPSSSAHCYLLATHRLSPVLAFLLSPALALVVMCRPHSVLLYYSRFFVRCTLCAVPNSRSVVVNAVTRAYSNQTQTRFSQARSSSFYAYSMLGMDPKLIESAPHVRVAG